jgi:hypothetical protein
MHFEGKNRHLRREEKERQEELQYGVSMEEPFFKRIHSMPSHM